MPKEKDTTVEAAGKATLCPICKTKGSDPECAKCGHLFRPSDK